MSKLKSLPAKALHHPCDPESIEFREALKLKKDDQDENDER